MPSASNGHTWKEFTWNQSQYYAFKWFWSSDLFLLTLPESIGWIPFKRTEMASSGIILETASMTSESLVKSLLRPTRKIKTIAQKTILMRMLVAFTTITENFATLGWAAPSSLLTRMLQSVWKILTLHFQREIKLLEYLNLQCCN